MNKRGSLLKRAHLFETTLSDLQAANTRLNEMELAEIRTVLATYPRRIVLELTNRCNFRCIMCGREAADFETCDLPFSLIKRLEAALPYVEEVTLHGWGEGTLHPRFSEILRFLNEYPNLRKYFVTNGSTLPKIMDDLFEHKVDLVALSLDGATPLSNNAIRRGGDFEREIASLNDLLAEKDRRKVAYPYINFVFTAMARNIDEVADMVDLAHRFGVPEVKVVYLTVFDENLLSESLYNQQERVRKAFERARKRATFHNIKLKLPEIQGEGEAGRLRHKPCPLPWRDLFVGSDGFIRPCQSSSLKMGHLSAFSDFKDFWNGEPMQQVREHLNDEALMSPPCRYCYHSSCANWNMPHSFIQLEGSFAPSWRSQKREIE